jgi:phosphoglycolate phosphatase
MRFRCLVFDLDGTLVDTTPALTIALDETLDGLGRRRLPPEAIARSTGHGLRALLRSAVLMTGEPLSDRDLSEAVVRFRAGWERELVGHAVAAEGALDAVRAAVAAGARAAVLTNKPTKPSVALLAALGYADLLDYVVGGDLGLPRKPDPAGLLTLLDHWQVRRDDSLLIGSSRVDLQTARNAEVQVALISPFLGRQRVFGLGADWTLERFDQLGALVQVGEPSRA